MSDKESIEDEFLKKNLPTNKKCPQCGKVYSDENILFCYYDGMRLTSTTQVPNQQPTRQRFLSPGGDFTGFELNLQNSAHNIQIPIEIIQSTTRLLQTNPKIPTESENVKSWFWSVPTPKKNRNILIRLISNVGLSGANLRSYIACYLLILITYGFWLGNADSNLLQEILNYDPFIMGQILLITVYTLVILILPILSLGYTESESLLATKNDFRLNFEPMLFITIIGLNYILLSIGVTLPILILPGEPKVKITPPTEYVVKSIKRSIYPSLLLMLGAFVALIILKFNVLGLSVGNFTMINIEILAYFAQSILLLETIPFGNTLGKVLLKHKPLTFYVSFTLIMIIVSVTLSIVPTI